MFTLLILLSAKLLLRIHEECWQSLVFASASIKRRFHTPLSCAVDVCRKTSHYVVHRDRVLVQHEKCSALSFSLYMRLLVNVDALSSASGGVVCQLCTIEKCSLSCKHGVQEDSGIDPSSHTVCSTWEK
ncbi:hypothetical protein KP509_04G050900 [Ceratopteris richardii]|uniref:Secreted protein n=1 Tax=Ceratopteris richardii TaxID=49495 RepID=A0A8T2USL9_CERRI|nr:hypothetical protein KP509_04G050900 [Ceratopteris richardii]